MIGVFYKNALKERDEKARRLEDIKKDILNWATQEQEEEDWPS